MNTPNSSRRGFTLVELLVAIALFSIIVTIAAGSFVRALRTEREVSSIVVAESDASVALEQMAREVRTGFLFCHDDNQPIHDNTCVCLSGGGMCGEAVGGIPVETADLNFYNSSVQNVNYELVDNTLDRCATDPTTGNLVCNPISGNADIHSLAFSLVGNVEGDHWPPRITMSMVVGPLTTDPSIASDTIDLQTSISARQIDCDPTGALGC